MTSILVTLGFAFIIVFFALLGLAIGRLLTGRTFIQPGACGRAPTEKKDKTCGTEKTCSLCNPPSSEKVLENEIIEKEE